MRDFDFIVVGGGPAGMMAAGRAAERGRRVLLLERGPQLGRKLLLTGSGRCNVTNSAPLEEFLKAFGPASAGAGFLRPAFTLFGNTQFLRWLHERGVETAKERKGRIFPASQDAHTILKALTDHLAAGSIEVRLRERVMSLTIKNGKVVGVASHGRKWKAPSVVIATGGLSYPATGCTGDGYDLARQAGHTVVPTYPAIVALETKEPWPGRVQGTPIKNVLIQARVPRAQERQITETFGEALWTHYGISGPAIFDISREVVLALRAGQEVVLELDLRPSDSEEALDRRLLEAIKRRGGNQVATVLSDWVAHRAATLLLELNGIEPRKKMNQCSRSDRRRIVKFLKHLELRVAGPRPVEEAIVTGGGVSLEDVDSQRMESRLVRDLFFAGEVLDIDGPSGGFNLQAAFSTGWLSGQSI